MLYKHFDQNVPMHVELFSGSTNLLNSVDLKNIKIFLSFLILEKNDTPIMIVSLINEKQKYSHKGSVP